MRKLRIYGYSDDLVYVDYFEGPQMQEGEPDEINYPHGGDPALLKITHGHVEGLLVVANYEKTSTWSVGIAQVAEQVPIPDWPVSFVNVHPYSVGLELVLPTGARVEDVTDRPD